MIDQRLAADLSFHAFLAFSPLSFCAFCVNGCHYVETNRFTKSRLVEAGGLLPPGLHYLPGGHEFMQEPH